MPEKDAAKGFDALMEIAGPGWGFCGCIKNGRVLHVLDLIPSAGPVSADDFVDWLFLADDMNPRSEPEKWQPVRQALRQAFIACMGAEIVDATQLQWSMCRESEA